MGGIGGAEPADAPRGGLGLVDCDRIGRGEPFDADGGAGRHVLALHHQLQAASRSRTVARTVEVEQRHAVQAGVRHQPLVPGDVPVVENHHELPQSLGRLSVAGKPAALAELVRKRRLQQCQRREEQAHRTHPVAHRGMLGVRQPLDPAPVLAVGIGRHHRDLHVVGSVKRAQLQHHCADQLLHEFAIALKRDGREGSQRHRRWQRVHDRMRLHEAAQRHRRYRFEVLGRPGLRGEQPRGKPVGPDTDAHMAVVRVGRPALPHAAGAHHVGQGARVGMTPFQRGALLAAGLVGLLAQIRQIAEVILTFLIEFRGGFAGAAGPTHEHARHRHDHHHREDQKHRVSGQVAAADRDHQRNHADDGDDHDERHQLALPDCQGSRAESPAGQRDSLRHPASSAAPPEGGGRNRAFSIVTPRRFRDQRRGRAG